MLGENRLWINLILRGWNLEQGDIVAFFQSVPHGTATDLIKFPSGHPVIFYWERTDWQGVNCDSQEMDMVKGNVQVFQISPYQFPNSSTWNYDRSIPISVWSPSNILLGENRLVSCGFLIHSGWILGERPFQGFKISSY